MDKKIMIIKAMGNKPIEVEIKDNSGVTHKGYIYNVNTNTCVITTEYIDKFIEPRNWDNRFIKINYTDINGIRITA